MTKEKDKLIYSSEPTVWYYLLALFFPTMFFLIDDWREIIFSRWDKTITTYIVNMGGLFLCFGVPILMVTLRRRLNIYQDRIEIIRPVTHRQSSFYFANLDNWSTSDIYIGRAGRQINLTLKFKNKKLTFNKIEVGGFNILVSLLETNYFDKKKL